MRLRLTSRLAVAFIFAVATVFLLLGVALTSFIGRENDRQSRTELHRKAALGADAALPVVSGASSVDPNQLARQISADSGSEVVIFGRDGAPLAFSGATSPSDTDPVPADVTDALSGQVSTVERVSETSGKLSWFVTAPVKSGDQILGAVQLSVPTDQLGATSSSERGFIAWVLAVAALATLMAIALVTHVAARPLVKIVDATRRVSRGDLSARAPEEGGGDFAALAVAFNNMANELQTTFDTIELERKRLESIVEHLADGIVIVDDEGKTVLMNRAAERLLGLRRDRAIGRSYAQVFRDYELVGAVRDTQAVSGPRTTPAERFIELGRPRRAVQAFSYPIPSEDVPLVLVVLRDITEFRRTEAVRRDFVANVSHDLRTPIASLKALVETLLDGALEDETVAREFLSRMQVEVDDLARLVEELLQLSRVEAGQIELRLAPGSLETVTTRVAERMRAQATAKQIDISVEAAPDLPQAMFDAERIEQVLVNLVHNAIKFTSVGGQVWIKLSTVDHEALVAVRDSGPGLEATELERVFERFYKADRSRTAAGSGLGLAIAKHLVQLHGGRIWAESDYGHGATFQFTLPLADASDPLTDEQAENTGAPQSLPARE